MRKTSSRKSSVRKPVKSTRKLLRGFKHAKPILFAAVFAVLGAVFLFRTFAAPEYPTKSDEVVLEYGRSGPTLMEKLADGTVKYNYAPVTFRLVGDGTLYCGDSENTTIVMKAKITPGDINKWFGQAHRLNVEQLPDDVTVAPKSDLPTDLGDYEYITLGGSARSKQVRVQARADKPELFNKFVDVGEELCASVDPTTAELIETHQVPGVKDARFNEEERSVGQKISEALVPKAEASHNRKHSGSGGGPKSGRTYTPSTSFEAEHYQDLRDYRAANGIPQAAYSNCLTDVARRSALLQAQTDVLQHRDLRNDMDATCGTGWSLVGENVGKIPYSGGSIAEASQALFSAYVASPDHLANIREGRFNAVGMGAYISGPCTFTNRDGSTSTYDQCMYNAQIYAICNSCVSGTPTQPPALTINNVSAPGFPAVGSTVNRGQELAVRIYINNGGGAASNAIIENAIPAYTTGTFQSGFAISGISNTTTGGSATTYYWWKMNLSAGSNGYVDMRMRVNSDAPSGADICNSASIRADGVAKIQAAQICFKVASTAVATCNKQINFAFNPEYQYDGPTVQTVDAGTEWRYYYYRYTNAGFSSHQITGISPSNSSYVHSDVDGQHGILMNYAPYFNAGINPATPYVSYNYTYNYNGQLWVKRVNKSTGATTYQQSSGGGGVVWPLTNSVSRAYSGAVNGPTVYSPCN